MEVLVYGCDRDRRNLGSGNVWNVYLYFLDSQSRIVLSNHSHRDPRLASLPSCVEEARLPTKSFITYMYFAEQAPIRLPDLNPSDPTV